MTPTAEPTHPFLAHPHRTLVRLSVPVLFSLIAEPVMGLVDTAFVARLGAAPLAGLGVATALLSGVFWVFNFLGIGTQTEVGRDLGGGERRGAGAAASVALSLSLAIGVGFGLLAWPWADEAASAMGATGDILAAARVYLRIRLLGGPAVLVTAAAFGALRGLQDMRTPLAVAVGANLLNAVLAPILIFGAGPLPAMGVAGAAWATTASQWAGALWAVVRVRGELGLPRPAWKRARTLLVTGFDLFLRTGSLILFLLLATRAATRLGADAGAAHQAIRQVWILTALVLDAYSATAQSLVSYFVGAERIDVARRVAAIACAWSAASGVALAASMLLGRDLAAALLVPATAMPAFDSAWIAASVAQPLNALSFATDGIHWGTGDYRYLRNAMLVATACGVAALQVAGADSPSALLGVWLATAGWIAVRAAFGLARVWPGVGAAPLRPRQSRGPAGADTRRAR